MSSPKEIRNYKFRIHPNKEQKRKLTNWLATCRIIYNSALADKKNYYERNSKGLTRIAQQETFKADKAKHTQVKEVHSQVAQEVLFRVERAFNNFFRRVQAGEKPGYPRYKGPGRYKFPNPGHLQKSERKLKTLQKSLSRKKKGSKNRARVRLKLARQHEKVRNQRKDFHHKVSSLLVWKYGTIVVEDLQIRNMVKNHNLAKSISDVGWGDFISMLSYKAESAGRMLVKVPPYGTTKECSRCGKTVPKDLSVRVYTCPHCGLIMDRDQNAAINILQKYKAS